MFEGLQSWDRPHSRLSSPVYVFVPVFLFPVKVNEKALLPLLLEELPHLHISSHTQGRMWQQQQQQVDRLHSIASPSSRRHSKLSSQVGPRLGRILQEQQSLCLTLLSFASRAAGGGPEEARPARRHRAQRPRTQKTPGERFTSLYVQCDLSAQAHARACNLCCSSVKTETLNLPERVEGAQPAAEVHPEPSEGAETAGGTR